MDRKLLQYLVEYLVEEGKAHGCALPPAAADAAQGGLASASTKAGLSSIAFCCISTGVFGFPQEEAASIAVATVCRWLNEHPDVPMTVVFNVFSAIDESLYRPLLGL